MTYGPEQAYTLCLFIFQTADQVPLVVSRQIAHKVPLGVPTLGGQVIGSARRPTFTWPTGATGTETFVLLQDGQRILSVTEAGAKGPTHPDPQLAWIDERPNGTSVVAMQSPMPPGRYGWRVVRTRDAGEIATSETAPFRLPGPPLTHLRVNATAQRGTTSSRPGSTMLTIRATPYARVTVTLRRGGRAWKVPFSWGSESVGTQRVGWTCAAPGDPPYRYTVQAQDDRGKTLRRSGRFSVVTAAHCRSMQAAEQQARAQRAAAALASARAEALRAATAERARYLRFVGNCRALGGTPVGISTSFGPETMCRAPYGGYLSFPF